MFLCDLLRGWGLCRNFFFFKAEDGILDRTVTGVQTCALPICTRTPCRTAAGWGRTSSPCGARPRAAPPLRCAPPGKRTPRSRRRTAGPGAGDSHAVRDRHRRAAPGRRIRVLHDARHTADIVQESRAGVARVECGDERLEQAGEPPLIRRLLELGREV